MLLDVRMPRRTGVEACRAIKEAVPSAKIIMLTVSDEEGDLYETVKNGASGYLLKDSSIEEVAQAIRVVNEGQSLISPSMAIKLIDEFKQMSKPDKQQNTALKLTERELEVLRLVARGLNNREVAKELFISENTVKNHVRNILEKLQLHSRMEAVMYADEGKAARPAVSRESSGSLQPSRPRRIALAAQGFTDRAHAEPTMRDARAHAGADRGAPGRLGQRPAARPLHAALLADGRLRRRPAAPGLASGGRAGWWSTGRTSRPSCRSTCGR